MATEQPEEHNELIKPLNEIGFIESLLFSGVTNIAKSIEGTTFGSNMSSVVENDNPMVRHFARHYMRKFGKGATYTTAAIIAVMQQGCTKQELVNNQESMKHLLAQHSFELVPDFDKLADFRTTERRNFYNYINQIAISNALESDPVPFEPSEIYTIDPSLLQFRFAVAAVGNELLEKLPVPIKKVFGFLGISLDSFGKEGESNSLIKLEDLLQMHLNSVRAIHNYVLATGTEETCNIDNLALNVLANRYIGVRINTNMDGYRNFTINDIDQACKVREMTIMIETTATILLHDLARQNKDIAEYLSLEETFHIFVTALESSTKLIGLWNDCGSDLLNFTDDQIDNLFDLLTTLEPEATTLREAMAPKKFREEYLNTKNITTDELAELRAKFDNRNIPYGVKVGFWKSFVQLIKDSVNQSESNLLLDFGANNVQADTNFLDYQRKIAKLLSQKTQLLQLNLKNLLLSESQRMPVQILGMLEGMRDFHYELYSPRGGDYYGSRNVSVINKLPVMRNTK